MGSLKLLIAQLCLLSVYRKTFAVDYHPPGYFNSSDVSRVTWAHAVNSKAELETNIKDDSIQMLEADVVIGKLENSTDDKFIAIMAHPPANVSDLSFAMFLEAVVEHNTNRSLNSRKGIKLDFKSYPAASEAVILLNTIRNNSTDPDLYNFPIWINADIFAGPVNASNPAVDASALCALKRGYAPDSTLSIGWTTRFGRQGDGEILQNGSYTKEHMDQMVDIITKEFIDKDASAEITFPLRGGLALNSLENIIYLLDESGINSTSPSITLWEGSDDPPLNLTQLDIFIEAVGRNRVFVDLPHSTKDTNAGWLAKSNSKILFTLLLVVAAFSRSLL